MSDCSLGIVSGIVGGMITVVIVFFFTKIYQNIIEPWFENLVYKGVRVDGKWAATTEIKGQQKSQIVVLKQGAHRICGTITYPQDTRGFSHTYEIEGWIFDNVLTLLLEEVGKGRLDRGALVLAFRPGLALPTMEGLVVWFDGTKPFAVEYKLTREVD